MHISAPYVLIDDATTSGCAQVFSDPVEVLRCDAPGDVPATLAKIEQVVAEGYHVAGYLAYELGYTLEPKLTPLVPTKRDIPLIWMGVFHAPMQLNEDAFGIWADDPFTVGDMHPTLGRDDYIEQVERIRDHIRAGDVYQINHTFKQRFAFSGSPLSLYAHLRQKQRAKYGGLIADGEQHILSLSPELFVETQKGIVRTRPMKGTASRKANPADDETQKHWLSHDEKSKAENLMIVDLLRNDLGRVALVGSVNVTDLFSVETYPTLHQMTSGIEAKLRPGVGFGDLARALFPCGSVTGAPKVKAMEIIRGLEAEERGVYTGAIGYVSPNGEARFNVAIRTLKLTNGTGEMGIGSGIVYDSDPVVEWDECHLKARFLTAPHQPFELLETLLWEPGTGFALLDRHLERLVQSAAYFGYPCDVEAVTQVLQSAIPEVSQSAMRVRLVVDENGTASAEAIPLTPLSANSHIHFVLSDQTIDTQNPFVFHKTTHRAFYDDERTRLHDRTGCDEVIFLNADGEITEGSITNVFVERDGKLLTPPISCGLLNGTLRQDLIETGRAEEAILKPIDLTTNDGVWLGNSVRGLMPAKLM